MTQSRLAILGMLLAIVSNTVFAQQHPIHHTSNPSTHPASTASTAEPGTKTAAPDPEITAALKQISADRIRHTIEKLVSFRTRLTISPATPEAISGGRGVGAAREWIRYEFQRSSDACGGCL